MTPRNLIPWTLLLTLGLAACGGSAAPSSAPAASASAKPAASASASAKPAASAPASAKPAASGSAAAKPAASGATLTVPPIPAEVAVTLDPTNTAFLVMDIATSNCVQATRPACVTSVGPINTLLKKARDAKVPVIYTFTGGTVLPDVAPQQGEPVMMTGGPDKFEGTNLDAMLKQAKVTNLLLVGSAANGAVLYTAFGSNARGYTVVVADDGMSSTANIDTTLTRWQLLNQPGFSNTENKPLSEKMVTESRSDLITFGTPASTSAAAKPAASTAASAGAAASAKPAASGSAAASAGSGAEAVPAIPAEVPVSVDPKTTALLVLDINSAVCQTNPACVSTVPAISALIKKARDAKASVIYSTTTNATVMPDVAPQPDEPTVTSNANKFFNTNLEDILKQKGVTTAVMVGSAANGAVLYTGFQAASPRGMTVVVADDGISSRVPFADVYTKHQLLAFPANADNKPLTPKAVTLSRSDLVTFSAASAAAKPAASGATTASAAAKPAASTAASAKPAASTASSTAAKPAASTAAALSTSGY